MEKRNAKAWLYLLPAILFIGAFMIYPLIDVFVYSFEEGAAVAIRSRWNADISDLVPSIKNLVKNSIEGLKYEKIAVTVFRDSPPCK